MKRLAWIAALSALSLPALAQSGAATAVMMDQSGTTLGTLSLADTDGGVSITGELTGVPNGPHGFHIHETGTCDASTHFESAGGHFNPDDDMHGLENPEGPHAGDLQNVTADADGNAVIELTNTMVSIESLMDADGSALVLHENADDQMTDPSGNSGDRFACGVIEGAI